MREINALAIAAKADPEVREALMRQQEVYILRCASKTCHRFVSKSDDEWSISLLAFSQAIDSYEMEKGNFLSFTDLVIKRRLIDYIKSQSKYSLETPIDPVIFDAEPDEEAEDLPMRMAVAEQVSKQDNGDLKLEIEEAGRIFHKFGFSFYDLSSCSPHAEKTRKACSKAVNYMLANPLLIQGLNHSSQLPLKMIEKNAKIPRKVLERYRKYIIAVIVILTGDFPNLSEYMRYIREEKEQ